MLTPGDKIRMVNSIGSFDCLIGHEFEVTEVIDGVVSLKSSLGLGVMSEDEFKKHFCMVRQWTHWIYTTDFYAYKTDNKKYVKVKKGNYSSKASCHPNDNFNLNTGIELCLKRIKDKEDTN